MYNRLRRLFIIIKYYRIYKILKNNFSVEVLNAFFINPKYLSLDYLKSNPLGLQKILNDFETRKRNIWRKKFFKRKIKDSKYSKLKLELDFTDICDPLIILPIAEQITRNDIGSITEISIVEDLKEFNKK